MKRISSVIELMQDEYDIVIIGSGYGGSVCASRMARAGLSVCLLERGKEIAVGEFPNTVDKAQDQLHLDGCTGQQGKANGLYQIHLGQQRNILFGCGLGGTSLINAAVAMKPDKTVFSDKRWPEAIRQDSDGQLGLGFQRAAEMLQPQIYPPLAKPLPKVAALRHSADKNQQSQYLCSLPLAVNFTEMADGQNRFGVEQSPCNNCGDCLSGCNFGAKNTLAMNYLPDAVNHGAEIFCEIAVNTLQRLENGWELDCQSLRATDTALGTTHRSVKAGLVIVAAGVVGTNEILLKSKVKGLPLSDKVGSYCSTNGDFVAAAMNCDVEVLGVGWGEHPAYSLPDVGPATTCAIDLGKAQVNGLLIQEVALPGLLASVLPELLSSEVITGNTDERQAQAISPQQLISEEQPEGKIRRYDNTQTYFVCGKDNSLGHVHLDSERLRFDWTALDDSAQKMQMSQIIEQLAAGLKGIKATPAIEQALFNTSHFVINPLGGCVMADSAENGVVNHLGQVFNDVKGTNVHSDLYVCDGSIIPTALAVGPSLTITALAERCCAIIAQQRGWTINYDTITQTTTMNEQKPLGIEFSESLRGYYHQDFKDEEDCPAVFRQSHQSGQADNNSIALQLTVYSKSLEQMIKSPEHHAEVVGSLLMPNLSEQPMMITSGSYRLFVRYPQTPQTKYIEYRLNITSEQNKQYFLLGHKAIGDNNLLSLWQDTSTLYFSLYEGDSCRAQCLVKGILRNSLTGFVRQLASLRVTGSESVEQKLAACARFGKYFAGGLWQNYGGARYQNSKFNPMAEQRDKRSLKTAPATVHWFETPDKLRLKLTRFRGGSKGPVILLHGIGTGSQIFSTDIIETNLVEFLYRHEYDVWLLDYRLSIGLEYTAHQSNADLVAQYDIPCAVEQIQQISGSESVQAVAHCYGSIALFMSVLSGLKGIRSIVCSQVACDVVTGFFSGIGSTPHLSGLLRHIGIEEVTSYTDDEANWLDRLFNKSVYLNALGQAQGQCDNPTCHRITFLYGSGYRHENLSELQHNCLHELYGAANVTALQHLAQMVEKKQLVDSHGEDRYLPQVNRLKLPVLFISGDNNECFEPKSTELTFNRLTQIHGQGLYERVVIPRYGHSDCIFGETAVVDVYPKILAHLNKS